MTTLAPNPAPSTTCASTLAPQHAMAATTAAAAQGRQYRGFWTLLVTEFKVSWLRDPSAAWALFPVIFLVLNGVMNREGFAMIATGPDFEGWDFYGHAVGNMVLPIFMAMGIAMTTLVFLPATFGALRGNGMLKLISASPMRPQPLFAMHAILDSLAAIASIVMMLIVAQLFFFQIATPTNLGVVLLGIGLGVAAMLAVGSLLAAVAPTEKVGGLIGQIAFFTFSIAGGMFGNAPQPGTFMYTLGSVTPVGATSQIIRIGFTSADFPIVQVIALVVWALVSIPFAVKLFKWR